MNSNKKINLLVDAVKLALIIFIACALVSLIVLIVSDDPMTAITSFFIGPFTSLRRIGNIIEAAAPLMFTALAVIIIFGSGQFSMIAEGSFFIGTSGAMIVAIACKLPGGLHPAVAILFAGFCGAIVSMIPALLKMKWNVSELVTSIMLNYVVQFFAIYLVSYHFREVSSSSLASLKFEETAGLPVVIAGTRIHAGIVLGIILCVLVWFFLYRTSFGTKLRITGENPLFAKYSGLRPRLSQVPLPEWVAVQRSLACITGLNGRLPLVMAGRVSLLHCLQEAIRFWFRLQQRSLVI